MYRLRSRTSFFLVNFSMIIVLINLYNNNNNHYLFIRFLKFSFGSFFIVFYFYLFRFEQKKWKLLCNVYCLIDSSYLEFSGNLISKLNRHFHTSLWNWIQKSTQFTMKFSRSFPLFSYFHIYLCDVFVQWRWNTTVQGLFY